MTADETLESLRAENETLKAQLGLNNDGTVPRELLFREIARGLLLEDDAVQGLSKFGHQDSSIRMTLRINGELRHLDCSTKKLARFGCAREVIADACDKVLDYKQPQWTKIANLILSAAEKFPGYERDTETVEWLTAFAQQACARSATYAHPLSNGAELFERILAHQGRRTSVQEASHMGELFFVRRSDEGISLGQADFIGFTWTHHSHRLGRAELTQRLASLRFQKAPMFARQDERVTKLKACWHSPAGWLKDHDVDLSVFHRGGRIGRPPGNSELASVSTVSPRFMPK